MGYLLFLTFSTGLAVLARSLYEAKPQSQAAQPVPTRLKLPGSARTGPPIWSRFRVVVVRGTEA
jgi:hypothetical protein